MAEFALHLTKCSRDKPRPWILSVQIESFISFSSNQACLITFQLKGPSVNVTSSRCFPFQRSHAKLFSRKQNDGILKCASAEFQASEYNSTDAGAGSLVWVQENFYCSGAVSAQGLFLHKWARSQAIEDSAKRNEQTKCHSPTLSIFDPWNRLKTGHLFMIFFPSP